eukprot:11169981-Alexandrium_andersonii.AAC.1
MTQGGSAHGRAQPHPPPGRHALVGGSCGSKPAAPVWEPVPPPPTEPRCVIEGRLKDRLEEMRDVRLGVASAPAKRVSKVDLWLVDTGCGHDLVSREHATQMK